MSSEHITIRLVSLRKHYKLTQQQLADKSGVGIATIRNIENGKPTSTYTLDKLNNALGGALY